MYKGIHSFKKGYQPRTNIVKGEKCSLVTDCHSILIKWRKHFSQLLNVQRINYVRQTEIHTAQPLVPKPTAFEVEMAIGKVKRHKSSDSDQIPAELFDAGRRTICSEIHKLTNSAWNKEKLPEEWKESFLVRG